MSFSLYKLGQLMVRRRGRALMAWLLALVLAVAGMATLAHGTNDESPYRVRNPRTRWITWAMCFPKFPALRRKS